jgi:hypothetical protein
MRFAHRENYYRQDQINKKFDTKLTLKKNEPFPPGVAMSELSKGIKKHALKSRETIPLTQKNAFYFGLGG